MQPAMHLLCMHGVYLKMRHARSCGHQIMRRCWSGWIIKDVSWSPWSITGHPRPSVQLNVLFQNPPALDMFSNKKNHLKRFHSLFFSTTMEVAVSKIILSFRAAPSESSDRFRYVMKHPKTPPSAKWSSTTAQGVDKLLISGVVFPTNGGEMESSWNHHPR